MKNKTLPILLLIPFVVALLAFVSVIALNNTVASDILGISWAYDDNEGFRIDANNGYALEAEPRIDETLILAPGNDLVWTVTATDGTDTTIARVENDNDNYFLYALQEGECKVICSNKRGTVSRFFTATIFDSGTIVINPKKAASGNSVEPFRTYGQYDFVYDNLAMNAYDHKEATFEIDTKVYFETDIAQTTVLVEKSDNIDYVDGKVIIHEAGDSYFTLRSTQEEWIKTTYSFKVIEGAYNIYSYDDLLMATNYSTLGEKAVLQTNLESLKNTYVHQAGIPQTTKPLSANTALYGHYNTNNRTFSFANDIYRFETTYNHDYITQYNNTFGGDFEPIVLAGIHVQQDFYGNGFKINFHELAYPTNGKVSTNGKLVPGAADLFHGPLPFVTIGPLGEEFFVKALGQDNVGMYVDGDNITVDNVELSNTNNINNMYDLTYTGSVVDVHGQNNTIKNSVISNGKTAVRAFDADGFTLKNSILKNAAEFLLKVGSNDVAKPNESQQIAWNNDKINVSKSFADFYTTDASVTGATANNLLSAFIGNKFGGHFDPDTTNQYLRLIAENTPDDFIDWTDTDMVKALEAVQEGLDNPMYANEPDHMNIVDTNFANSGIFSIALETSFNGAYLYEGLPGPIAMVVEMLGALAPYKVGGTSRPIDLTLSGETDFYDWKDVDTIDLSTLMDENIAALAAQAGSSATLTIDDYFPVKKMLKEAAKAAGCIYKKDGKEYINTEVAWYGGGRNDSTVNTDALAGQSTFSDPHIADLIAANIGNKYIANVWYMEIFAKAVLMASGTHPFRFATNEAVGDGVPALYGQSPQVSDLIANYSA